MRRLVEKWLVGGLFVAFLISELWFAFDRSDNTWPLTKEITSYVPAWIATAIALWFARWIVPHFEDAYRKEGTMTTPLPDEKSKEPLLTVGTVTAAATAVLGLLVTFGLDLSDKRQASILAVVAVLAPLAVAWVARRKVYAPATVAKLLKGEPVNR
jgi:hypothetical protein